MFGRKLVDVQIVSKDPEAQSVQNQMNTGNACFGNKKQNYFLKFANIFIRTPRWTHSRHWTDHSPRISDFYYL